MSQLKSNDVEVIGISGDNVKSHQMFKKVHKLNFTLLADDKGTVAKAFGVPVRKGGSLKFEVDGKLENFVRGVTTGRQTFIIDKAGKIAFINRKVNASKDSKKVLEVIKELKAKEGLNVGDKLPKFEAKDDQGKVWKSTDHVGKKILVFYFYPANMTGGCTKQACAYRDDREELKKLGVEVIGVSGDNVKSHQVFKKAHNLNFTLLADEKGQLAKIFGVNKRKGGSLKREVDGKEVTLIRSYSASRWTYVIGLDGKLKHKNQKVKAAQDSKDIIKLVKKMKAAKKDKK